MVKHNNVVTSGRFKKDRQSNVKTWFNQTARRARRSIARQKNAVKIFPRPTAGPIRPVVHGQTLKYNMKLRAGRGLRSLRYSSLESLQTNIQRLKAYKAKLVVFPRRALKFKDGDSAPEEPSVQLVKVTNKMKYFKAYDKLRVERMNKRQTGARMKKASEAEKAE